MKILCIEYITRLDLYFPSRINRFRFYIYDFILEARAYKKKMVCFEGVKWEILDVKALRREGGGGPRAGEGGGVKNVRPLNLQLMAAATFRRGLGRHASLVSFTGVLRFFRRVAE